MTVCGLLDRPENAGLLRYLDDRGGGFSGPAPAGVDRWLLGTHPDIVDHLWDGLASWLPHDARWLVCGGPGIVHPRSGVVLALGLGTEYALRVPPSEHDDALRSGAQTVHVYRPSDVTLDLAVFGPDWVFGAWNRREADWVAAAYRLAGS